MGSIAPTKTELIDLWWRSIWTFIEVSLALVTGDWIAARISEGHSSVDAAMLPVYAGIGAVLALIKAYASNKNGTGTATSRPSAAVGLSPVASNEATPAT